MKNAIIALALAAVLAPVAAASESAIKFCRNNPDARETGKDDEIPLTVQECAARVATPARTRAGTAFPSADWERRDLVQAEELLDGICRGAASDGEDVKLACMARQILVEAIYKDGWCYGKYDQAGNEMQWHKCGKNSQRPTRNDDHSYDVDY
jgi:hypothetical protein